MKERESEDLMSKEKDPLWYRALFVVPAYAGMLAIAVGVSAVINFSANWWKNTDFVDNLTHKWEIEGAYNTGRFHERMCTLNGWRDEKKKQTMSQFQIDFCKQHDDYKNHPKRLGD